MKKGTKKNKIVVKDLEFELSKISDLEIKFSRQVLDEIIVFQDFIYNFEIQTNPMEFRKFIIHVIRKYDTFQNDLLNHLTYPD